MAARRHYRGLTWLGRARCAGGAAEQSKKNPESAIVHTTEQCMGYFYVGIYEEFALYVR